jgi:hypothetical protein
MWTVGEAITRVVLINVELYQMPPSSTTMSTFLCSNTCSVSQCLVDLIAFRFCTKIIIILTFQCTISLLLIFFPLSIHLYF